jgi:hypothetical protein
LTIVVFIFIDTNNPLRLIWQLIFIALKEPENMPIKDGSFNICAAALQRHQGFKRASQVANFPSKRKITLRHAARKAKRDCARRSGQIGAVAAFGRKPPLKTGVNAALCRDAATAAG